MNDALNTLILVEFRHMFDYEGSECYPIKFGIEAPDGWFDIIYNALKKLSKNPDIKVHQIKEKFGGLRIYVEGATKEECDIIQEAEDKASKTCTVCGNSSSGPVMHRHWIYNLCEVHLQKETGNDK